MTGRPPEAADRGAGDPGALFTLLRGLGIGLALVVVRPLVGLPVWSPWVGAGALLWGVGWWLAYGRPRRRLPGWVLMVVAWVLLVWELW